MNSFPSVLAASPAALSSSLGRRVCARLPGVPLYKHISNLAGNKQMVLPVPAFNIINGGSHAGASYYEIFWLGLCGFVCWRWSCLKPPGCWLSHPVVTTDLYRCNVCGAIHVPVSAPASMVVRVSAGNKLAMQEFMVLPVGADSFSQAMQMGCEVYHNLKVRPR